MSCDQVRPWLGALLDGELDARNSAEIQAHLVHCASCLTAYRADEAMRTHLRKAGLRHEVPDSLRDRVMSSIKPPAGAASVRHLRTQTGARGWRWMSWAGWGLAAAASALLALSLADQRADVRDQQIALHIRSLLADHLTDVTSSDRHTVKPWFAGKLDFAPPVPDLGARGYPLVGGRIEYLDGWKGAALVYKRRAHVINVVIRPRDSARGWMHFPFSVPQGADTHRGYSRRTWEASGLSFVAVSDLNPVELEGFERAFISEAAPPR